MPETGTADAPKRHKQPANGCASSSDGGLVENLDDTLESLVAMEAAFTLRRYLPAHPLGAVLGARGLLQIDPKLVHGADVSFISWDRFLGRTLPAKRACALVSD